MITELNCFKWNSGRDGAEGNTRTYFGYVVDPHTETLEQAIAAAKKEIGDHDTYVCGYYVDGTGYCDGEYNSMPKDKDGYDIVGI